jgi:hypothetical protein
MLSLTIVSLLFFQVVSSTSLLFPIFPDGRTADGTIHTTALVVQNPSLSFSTSCTITFSGSLPEVTSPDGTPVRSHVIVQTLPPGGFNVLRSTTAGEFTRGYVKLFCLSPVTAHTIYSVFPTGDTDRSKPLSEVTMQSALAATSVQFINDDRRGGRLALALTNDLSFSTLVQLTVGDLLGRTLYVTNVILPPYSTLAKFLDEIVPDLPRNHVGPVVLRSQLPIYATGLRFTATTVTAISPAAQFP